MKTRQEEDQVSAKRLFNRTLVLGDVHGAYLSLDQCFKRSKFDYEKDRLVVLGDVCDRWRETAQVIDELLKVKNCVMVMGNHDYLALQWDPDNRDWMLQGGRNTVRSYQYLYNGEMPESHQKFLRSAPYYYEEGKRLYVHGGFKRSTDVTTQDPQTLMWDRKLLDDAFLQKMGKVLENTPNSRFEEVFLGHTPTGNYDTNLPMHVCEVWNVDTGGGCAEGYLTIMDVETKQYWQSDRLSNLYNAQGRRRLG